MSNSFIWGFETVKAF